MLESPTSGAANLIGTLIGGVFLSGFSLASYLLALSALNFVVGAVKRRIRAHRETDSRRRNPALTLLFLVTAFVWIPLVFLAAFWLVLWVAIPLTTTLVVYYVQARNAHKKLLTDFQRRSWRPDQAPPVEAGMADQVRSAAPATTEPNSTVYSRSFLPFVGAGIVQALAEPTLSLAPAREVDRQQLKPQPSTMEPGPQPSADALFKDLLEECRSLGLPDLSVRRWHFAHGVHAEFANVGYANDGRPTGIVDIEAVRDGQISDEFVRPYVWLSSSRWGGELVMNSFIRVRPAKKGLFVELSHHVLLPVNDRAHRVDRANYTVGPELWLQHAADAIRNALDLPGNLWWLLSHRLRWAWRRYQVANRTARNAPVDRGAPFSIRDIFSGDEYQHYFQAMDSEMYQRVVNEALIEILDQSLRKSGWAIVGLQNVVQNLHQTNNTINNSGVFNAQNLAQGQGNTATSTQNVSSPSA